MENQRKESEQKADLDFRSLRVETKKLMNLLDEAEKKGARQVFPFLKKRMESVHKLTAKALGVESKL